jgi:hypothetical protein
MREVQSQKLKVEEEEGPRSKLGIVGIRPGSSRKSGKERSYRIRNLEVCTENGR